VGKIFFGYEREDLPVVQLMDELTVYDVFFSMDVPSLIKGEENIEPRDIVSAPFKFINEFQRGNYKIYNTLLGLFSEGFVTIRDKKFRTREYLAILDANPFDTGSVEVPNALMDRITGSVNIRSMDATRLLDLMDSERVVDNAKKVLTPEDMLKIWAEVEKVHISEGKHLLMALLHSYFSNCIYGDKAVMNHRHVANLCSSCQYRTEPCSMVQEPLGHRWWKDAKAIARARAYYQGRKEVNVDDVFFAAFYALQHRISLREKVKVLYPSTEDWLRESLDNAMLKLKKIWIPALKGNEKAQRSDMRTLMNVEVGE